MLEVRSYQQIKSDAGTSHVQLIIVTGLLALSWLFEVPLLAYIAGGIGLLCLTIPPAGFAIVWFWYKMAQILGYINAHVLLSVIYYLMLTPISIFFRLSGNDPLKLKKPERSVYTKRDYTYKTADIKNPW